MFAGNYIGDGIESGYLDSSLGEDDESIVDKFQYSLRIEKLRQEHMEREKPKLREQQTSFQHHHQPRSVSVWLRDESAAVSVSSSGSASRNHSDVSNFEDLEISEQKSEAVAINDMAASLMKSSAGTSKTIFSSTMPLPSTSSSISRTPDDPNANEVRESSLLSIDIRRRWSFSIPDRFEMLERSIA